MSRFVRLRSVTAYCLWVGCVALALLIAGGALLVGLKADASAVPWSWWLGAVDAMTPGWFHHDGAGSVGAADVANTVLRWGVAAVGLLAIGVGAQWVVRPR